MTTKIKMIFFAALAAVLIALPRAQAANSGVAPTNAVVVDWSSSNAPADATATATNSKPVDVLTSLFGDPVIARGKGVEVKQSQLEGEMVRVKATLAAQGRTVSADDMAGIEAKVLNSLITKQLLLAKATAADKAQGREEFDKIEQQLKTSAKLTDEQFDQRLNQQLKLMNISKEEWEKQSIEQTTTLIVLKRELNINETDADAKAYYTNHPADFEEPEKARVRHILLLTMDPATHAPLPDDQQKAKRKQADDILKRARAGEDFAKLAKEYSEDPGSKDNGGELPLFDKDGLMPSAPGSRMAPEFTAAAFSLTTNQISDVVITQLGYHIIQLLDKTPARKVDYATVADNIKEYLAQQKMGTVAPPYLEKLTQSADVEILDADLKAAADAQTNAPAMTPAK
jgi:parvulin-like peptidyl-prolyl isomerase